MSSLDSLGFADMTIRRSMGAPNALRTEEPGSHGDTYVLEQVDDADDMTARVYSSALLPRTLPIYYNLAEAALSEI